MAAKAIRSGRVRRDMGREGEGWGIREGGGVVGEMLDLRGGKEREEKKEWRREGVRVRGWVVGVETGAVGWRRLGEEEGD